MLSAKDNDRMCRVGPGTPMGKAIRQVWVPALLSSELPAPDCDPVHVELLGESFVAFRDSEGKVGMLDEFCCHRGASLTLGRSEDCGLRCIYHGWLFATDGTVMETPNIADPKFKTRFKAKSYPVREAGGLVWTYIGDPADMPEFYDFPYLSASASKLLPAVAIVGCNFVQVMEGLFDSSHLSVLHVSQFAGGGMADIKFTQNASPMQHNPIPRIEVEETPYGFTYGAVRDFGDTQHTNVTGFVAPFFMLNPNDIYMAVVPMNDEKCAFYHVWYDGVQNYGEEPLSSEQLNTVGLDRLEDYGMTRQSFYGPNRPSRANGFRQDRDAMKDGHFTGIASFTQEDAIVCMSGGGIRDREYEHLGTADMAIAQLYRSLLKSAKQAEDGGRPLGYGMSFANVRGTHSVLPTGSDWRTLVPNNIPQKKVA